MTRYRVAVYVDGSAPPALPVRLVSEATREDAEATAERIRTYVKNRGWTHRVQIEPVEEVSRG